MSQLKRAEDDHLYLLAGRSQGTRQVSPEGESWLLRQGYQLPQHGVGTYIDAGTCRYLSDSGYLSIKGIPYSRLDTDFDVPVRDGPSTTGLPLLLHRNDARADRPWTLELDLAPISEQIRIELRQQHAGSVTVTGMEQLAVPLRQLDAATCVVHVIPQSGEYVLRFLDSEHSERDLRTGTLAPGLNNGWQGNVFTASRTNPNLWRRCLPNTSITFAGAFMWLGRVDLLPEEWPGDAVPIGPMRAGWQLWHLSAAVGASADSVQ